MAAMLLSCCCPAAGLIDKLHHLTLSSRPCVQLRSAFLPGQISFEFFYFSIPSGIHTSP